MVHGCTATHECQPDAAHMSFQHWACTKTAITWRFRRNDSSMCAPELALDASTYRGTGLCPRRVVSQRVWVIQCCSVAGPPRRRDRWRSGAPGGRCFPRSPDGVPGGGAGASIGRQRRPSKATTSQPSCGQEPGVRGAAGDASAATSSLIVPRAGRHGRRALDPRHRRSSVTGQRRWPFCNSERCGRLFSYCSILPTSRRSCRCPPARL